MSPAVDMLFQGHSIVTNRGKDWLIAERLFNLRKIYFKKENLKKRTRDLLDNKGTYIIVCFGQDFTDQQHSDAISLIKDFLTPTCNETLTA